MNAERLQFVCDKTRSRRLLLKRVALLGAALLAPAILGASGCATTRDETYKNDGDTVENEIAKPRLWR